ncbi:hypothetical protein LEN26_012704 [Aphanomyces euteiches]|nr:hypothetical protein LEN26_012704 [Aphanomyces euteiches]
MSMWYERLLGLQMTKGGVKGVLIAAPDENSYKLKQVDGKMSLIPAEYALLAKRIELDGTVINFGAQGKGKIRSMLGEITVDGGMCTIEWENDNQRTEVPLSEILQRERDPLIGIEIKKTYDEGLTYNLKVAESVIHHGERNYEAYFDDGDVDVIPKDEIIAIMDPKDNHEKCHDYDEITFILKTRKTLYKEDARVTVRFWSKIINFIVVPCDSYVCVRDILKNQDGSQSEALACGLVDIGDKIVAINGQTVENMELETFRELLSSLPRPVEITFLKKYIKAPVELPIIDKKRNDNSALEQILPSSSLSDVMFDVREAISAGHFIAVEGDDVVFYSGQRGKKVERKRKPAASSTGFINQATKQPYDLVTIVTYIKYRYLSFADYMRQCRNDKIPIISPADIKSLMLFLNGRDPPVFTSPDTSNEPSEVPTAVPVTPPGSDEVSTVPMPTSPEKRKKRGADDSKPRTKATKKSATTIPPTPSPSTQIVSLVVHEQGLKISLIDGYTNRYPIVNGFNQGPDHSMGEIEASGLVKLGAELTHVNLIHVARMTVAAVADLIRIVKRPLKVTFKNRETKS